VPGVAPAVAVEPKQVLPLLLEQPPASPSYATGAQAFEREPAWALKAPVAPTATSTRREEAPLGLFQALALRVRSLGVEVPLWTFLVPLLGALLSVATFVAFAVGSRHAPPLPRVTPSPSPSPVVSAAAAAAAAASPPAFERAAIEAKSPESRTAAEVLALAEIAAEKKRTAAAGLNAQLLQTPSVLRKKGTISELRKLIDDPLTAPQTLAAVANLPGPVRADLLYELWSGTPQKTDGTELARALLSSQDVRSKAPEALLLSLQLRAVGSCSDLSPLLERAREIGDSRSLAPLTKWQRKRVCSAASQSDCCSADQTKALQVAMDAVKGRKAPFH
jgi:hypothetical protein